MDRPLFEKRDGKRGVNRQVTFSEEATKKGEEVKIWDSVRRREKVVGAGEKKGGR